MDKDMDMKELLLSIGNENDVLYESDEDTVTNDEEYSEYGDSYGEQYSGEDQYSRKDTEDEDYDDFEDFPYEENIFILNKTFTFSKRITCSKDVVVYKANYRVKGTPVAIKIVQDHLDKVSSDGVNLIRLPREVKLLKMLQDHPSIVRFLCWIPLYDTECYAIIMEYVSKKHIESSNLISIKKYMKDVLSALDYMHKRNIIYRDIKPSNIIFDGEKAVIIDFDCSVIVRPDREIISTVGTDGYMAPEILKLEKKKNEIRQHHADGEIDKKQRDEEIGKLKGYSYPVDIYSAGITFGQLLFGVRGEGDMEHEQLVLRIKGFDVYAQGILKKFDNKIRKLKQMEKKLEEEEDKTKIRDNIKGLGVQKKEFRNYISACKPGHELITRMIEKDPEKRVTIEECLAHPFLADDS